jgi:hypothetical protein
LTPDNVSRQECIMSDPTQARALLPRQTDLARLFAEVRQMNCVSVVGVSNLGKSALLRALTLPQIQAAHLGEEAAGYLFIYIDFNQMLEMSEQAFSELVLRCAMDTLRDLHSPASAEVLSRVEAAYMGLVAPGSSFEVPLRFAQAMTAIGDLLPQRVVFLLDEADGPVGGIDARLFLNLRALKDRHGQGLTYITATNRRLEQIRQDPDVLEFAELFAHHTLYVSPLDEAETDEFISRFAAAREVTFSQENRAFIRAWSGGHPGIIEATCRVLGLLTGRPQREPSQDIIIHRRAAEVLPQDISVQGECRAVWNDLTPEEQEALLWLHRHDGESNPPAEMDSVAAKHLVIGVGPERRLFARAFADYVGRQHATRRSGRQGIKLDPESGEVSVNGVQIPTLTNLEYRLLLLLYGRLGKICDKYEVVEAVWGEDYIDQVDDARIEKLVSRLRQKIEPDAANPKYLLTIRGRGYKLVEG